MKQFVSLKNPNFVIPVISTLFAVIMLFKLPDIVPSHFNLSGEVDGYGSKYHILVLPGATWFVWFVSILEKEKNQLIHLLINVFLLYLEIIVVKSTIAPDTNVVQFVFVGFGLVIACLGFLLPNSSRSFLSGVRTKKSLSSEEEWEKTNKFGGRISIFAGIAMIICSLFVDGAIGIVLSLMFFVAIPVVILIYSNIK